MLIISTFISSHCKLDWRATRICVIIICMYVCMCGPCVKDLPINCSIVLTAKATSSLTLDINMLPNQTSTPYDLRIKVYRSVIVLIYSMVLLTAETPTWRTWYVSLRNAKAFHWRSQRTHMGLAINRLSRHKDGCFLVTIFFSISRFPFVSLWERWHFLITQGELSIKHFRGRQLKPFPIALKKRLSGQSQGTTQTEYSFF